MATVVTCDSCGSRYQFDEALLKGAKGARIRCRSCGGTILVRKEDPPESEKKQETVVFHDLGDLFVPRSEEEAPAPSVTFPGTTRLRSYLLLAFLSVLLLGAGSILVARPNILRFEPEDAGRFSGAADPVKPAYGIRDTVGYPGRTSDGHDYFVVNGTVANIGNGASDGIRILVSLLGTDNRVLLEGESFAGNILDNNLLPHMTRLAVTEYLGMRYGEENSNRNIPSGDSLPFMVVCFDPPGPVKSFSVKAMDAGAGAPPIR